MAVLKLQATPKEEHIAFQLRRGEGGKGRAQQHRPSRGETKFVVGREKKSLPMSGLSVAKKDYLAFMTGIREKRLWPAQRMEGKMLLTQRREGP